MKKLILLSVVIALLCILTACAKESNELEQEIINYALEELELSKTDYTATLNKVCSEIRGTTEYAQYILTLEQNWETKLYQVDANLVNGEVRYVDVIRQL